MKRISRVGTLILLAPLAGCASFSLGNRPEPSATLPTPRADSVAPSADLDSALLAAQIRRKAGDLPGAAKALSQLVLVAPDDPRVLGEYGKTLAGQGRSDDALAFLERATQLQPGDWTLYSAQGIAHDQKGNYPAAQMSYGRALQLSPGEPTVLNNDALSHMQAGDLDGAERLLRQATPGTPEYPRIAQNLALVERLRIMQPRAMAAPVTDAAPALFSQNTPPAPPPKPAPVPEPAPMLSAAPVTGKAVVSEPAVETRVATLVSPPMPEIPVYGDMRRSYAALKADPTVVMAPLPKDDPAQETRKKTVKLETAAPSSPAKEPSQPKPLVMASAATPNRTYYVQAGAYATETRAGERASTLDALGARVMHAMSNGREIYRVWIGPFLSAQQANAVIAQAEGLGYDHFRVVTP